MTFKFIPKDVKYKIFRGEPLKNKPFSYYEELELKAIAKRAALRFTDEMPRGMTLRLPALTQEMVEQLRGIQRSTYVRDLMLAPYAVVNTPIDTQPNHMSRMASRRPNLQNMPRERLTANEIRMREWRDSINSTIRRR